VRDLVKLGVLKMKKIGTSEVVLLDRNKDREVLETVANHVKTVKGVGN
jgi:F420-dependent methylenetetrahydromethanopterin dehydrogenase